MNITVDNNTGGLAFWTNVEDLPRSIVMAAAAAAGIEKFIPERPAVSTALRTAMEDYAKDRFGRRRNEPIQILQTAQPRTFECVRCVRGTSENEHKFLFSASVGDNGIVTILSCNQGGYVVDGVSVSDFSVKDSLQYKVDEQLTILPGVVITRSLANALRSWGCQCLNDRGGLWFMPSSHVGAYQAWADVFSANSLSRFVLAGITVSHNPDFVSHLIDEVRADVYGGLNEIMQDMLNATGGMQDRSIRLRMERAQEFLNKVTQYESITGVAMQDMRDAIEKAKQSLAIQRMVSAAV